MSHNLLLRVIYIAFLVCLKREPSGAIFDLVGKFLQSRFCDDNCNVSLKSFILCPYGKMIHAKQVKVHFAISKNVTNIELNLKALNLT